VNVYLLKAGNTRELMDEWSDQAKQNIKAALLAYEKAIEHDPSHFGISRKGEGPQIYGAGR
jgi:hypothetical protein